MSRFHSMFSIGGMAGAAVGGLIAAQGATPQLHLLVASGLFMAISLLTAHWLLDVAPIPVEHRRRFRLQHLSPVLLALIIVGFSLLLSEAAIGDWSAVYLRQALGAGPALAADAYAVFSAGMVVFRFLGDAITNRIGPVATVRGGALLAASGLSWALLAPTAYWTLPGFALTGVGFSSIVPLVFGAGGRLRSVPSSAGVALVAGSGYVGFVVGPPAIGLLASRTSLRLALFLVVALSLVAAIFAGAVKVRD
jgi:fucose permease